MKSINNAKWGDRRKREEGTFYSEDIKMDVENQELSKDITSCSGNDNFSSKEFDEVNINTENLKNADEKNGANVAKISLDCSS